jgi:lipopolysaccharide export system protein LptC
MPQDAARTELAAEAWAGRARVAARPSRRYTRFVALMKFVLPLVAASLLALVAVWPQIQASLDRLSALIPRLDLREARDLRMVNARFSGVDKDNRPYTVTADVARQTPSKDDLVALEGPKFDITLQNGVWIALTSDTGVYLQQPQVLDLFGQVHVFHDRGIEFTTDSARIFLGQGTAAGDEHIEGQGSFGALEAEGFRVLDRGERVIFTGKARLLLAPRPSGGNS